MKTGFSTVPHSRVKTLILDQSTVRKFCIQVNDITIQAIEYKPFLRFKLANILNEATDGTLAPYLQSVLHDRSTGAVVIDSFKHYFKQNQYMDLKIFGVLLSTAISHLIGLPNLDSMSGKFYARFTVNHTDDSDSYLRQAYRRLELHTDGTFVDEKTDWVLMQKLESLNCKGGESLLLHVDDWQDLDKFYNHSLAKENIQWGSPPSKNVSSKVYHPVFFDGPCMSFIDQFAEPQNMEEGIYLNDISESLETDTNTIAIDIPDNGILIINNSFWLHGRDEIKENINLSRELLRQRGVFA
jgi:protein CsiD